MIQHLDLDNRTMFNVLFKTQTTSQISVTIPTVAFRQENGNIHINFIIYVCLRQHWTLKLKKSSNPNVVCSDINLRGHPLPDFTSFIV